MLHERLLPHAPFPENDDTKPDGTFFSVSFQRLVQCRCVDIYLLFIYLFLFIMNIERQVCARVVLVLSRIFLVVGSCLCLFSRSF